MVKTPPSHGGNTSSSLVRVTTDQKVIYKIFLIGVDCKEVPPVPIPNTEVKLFYVENTWLVTAREFRKMPV